MQDAITDEALTAVYKEHGLTTYEAFQIARECSDRSLYGMMQEQREEFIERVKRYLAERQTFCDNSITELRGSIHDLQALDILARVLVRRFGCQEVRKHLR